LFEGAIFFFAFYALGVRTDPLMLLFIFYFADTIGVITNLPAALGSFDITAITLSEILVGIPGITSLSAIMIFRLFNLVEPAIIGYLSYLVFSKFYEQRLVQRRRATRS
jgi:phosphatidylglycerol lysyltransferase